MKQSSRAAKISLVSWSVRSALPVRKLEARDFRKLYRSLPERSRDALPVRTGAGVVWQWQLPDGRLLRRWHTGGASSFEVTIAAPGF